MNFGQNVAPAPQAPVARSVMDLFTGLPAPVAPQSLPQPAQNFMPQPTQPTQQPAPTAQQAQQAQPQGPQAQPQGPQPTDTQAVNPPTQSPMDNWNNLFQNPKDKQPAPTPQDTLSAPLFNITPDQVAQAVAKRDFVGQVDPQLMQRALSGDTTAFSQVLNSQAQNMFSNVLSVVQNMVERGVQTYNSRLSDVLPQKFSSLAANASIAQAAPALNHQALSPVVSQVQSMIQSQNPQDPPHIVAQKVQKYFTDLAATVAPPQPAVQRDPLTGMPVGAEGTGGQAPTNWSNFFNT